MPYSRPELREQPLEADTFISLSPHMLERFRAKLQEYERRDSARFIKHQNSSIAVDSNWELIRFHRVKTLSIIIGIAACRDTIVDPISMNEVASTFKSMTNIDVLGATAIPIVVRHGARGPWTTPYVEAIEAAAGPNAAAFADAYTLFCAYAADRDDMLWGGTGLPQIPQ